jgi:hypothetical protein
MPTDDGGAIPCQSLTNEAIQAVIDKISASRDKTESDAAANGITGKYASAARDNLAYTTAARNKVEDLLTWLHTAEVLGTPPDPPTYVSNVTGAYNVMGYLREALFSLHYARHWAMISATFHSSADAEQSYELTSQALALMETLGTQAGRCFMDPYKPFA